MSEYLHPRPILRNTVDHIVGGAFQINAGSAVFGVFFQHLVKLDAGFGEFTVIIKTETLFKFIFGLFFPWVLERAWPVWPWIIAAPFWLLALIRPLWLRWIYRAWMRFGLLAGRVMTPLVLGIVFFAMISPMAIVRRLMGKDPMQRTLEPDQKSYRVQSLKSPAEKLEKPF